MKVGVIKKMSKEIINISIGNWMSEVTRAEKEVTMQRKINGVESPRRGEAQEK